MRQAEQSVKLQGLKSTNQIVNCLNRHVRYYWKLARNDSQRGELISKVGFIFLCALQLRFHEIFLRDWWYSAISI